MAQPVSNTPSVRSAQGYYTVGTGFGIQNTNTSYATANVPNDNASTLLGVDAVKYGLNPGTSNQYTFANLPVRNNRANPLQPTAVSQAPFTVNAQDTLIFVCFEQGNSAVGIQPYGLTKENLIVPGPFLGSDTYIGFGVTITAPSGATASSGTIVGLLFLQRGNQ
jgi:hypothetical protein